MKNMQDVLVKVERSIATRPVELKARPGDRIVITTPWDLRSVPCAPAGSATTSKYTLDQF